MLLLEIEYIPFISINFLYDKKVVNAHNRFANEISIGIVEVPAAIRSAIKESGGNVITQQESVALSLRSIRPVKNRV